MNEIHALSGAYAVDALDDLERARFEQHLADCAECRAEVASLREAAALLPEAAAVAPPAELRANVLDAISRVRPLPPLVEPKTLPTRRWSSILLTAAVTVFILGGAAFLVHPWSGSTSQQITVANKVIAAHDAHRHTVSLPVGGTATLVDSPSIGRAVLLTKDLADPPKGKTYELWLQSPSGTMEPAGLLKSGGEQKVLFEGSSAKAVGAGITVEPAGGSKAPTTEPIALFNFRSA